MDLFNKHYEKLILVVCLILMILGLLKVSDIVGEANADKNKDRQTKANVLDPSKGDMVGDFDSSLFVSKEAWVQRIKERKPEPVMGIAQILASPSVDEKEDITRQWDRRYFSVFTHHSRKPIEETEAKYRLEKNHKSIETLKEGIRQCNESINRRIAENGDKEDDPRLAELRLQLEGFQKLLANTEMDIIELNNRIRYITMFCTTQGSMVDPHEIICCPNASCGGLIRSQMDMCPFCGTVLPAINPADDDGKDSDGDGLPDDFELAHAQKRGFLKVDPQNGNGIMGDRPMGDRPMGDRGAVLGDRQQNPDDPENKVLDPYNPTDAYADFDGDSFTNLEEYRFGTDIDDETSFPSPANYVRVDKFAKDTFPVKLMGINDGKAGKDQKLAKWRARFSFMHTIRGREIWDTNEDRWEQVRIGKKFEAPDGKEYVLLDLDEEEVNGEKKAVAKLKEYVRPVRTRNGDESKKADTQEAKEYTLYQDKETKYDTMYAHLVYFPNRSASMLEMIYTYGRYGIQSGAKYYKIETKFKVEEGETVKLSVPVMKPEDKTLAVNEDKQGSRLKRRGAGMGDRAMGDMPMGGDRPMGDRPMGDRPMGRPGMIEMIGAQASREIDMKEFEFKVTAFDLEKKTLVLTPVDAKDAKASFTIGIFDEDETYLLPDNRKYLLFYEGNGGMGGRDMPMDGPRGARGGMR